jgi:beta-glucosidase-like glycosyl hydrolase
MGHRVPVTALGEATSLADRKRRAAERLVLVLPATHLDPDLRAVLRVYSPLGFALDPAGAEEPAQVQDLCAELGARPPAARPALLLQRGGPCPGATAWPPFVRLSAAKDTALTRAVGRAWRREAAALGFHVMLGPDVEGLDAATTAALVAPDDEAAAACPLAFTNPPDGRPNEQDLPGLLAEDLAPVRTALGAGARTLLAGHRVWSAFDERLPASACPALLGGRLRQAEGFRGLLLGEDLSLPAGQPPLAAEERLRLGVLATVDAHLVAGSAAAWLGAWEAGIHLQEEEPGLDLLLEESEKRLRLAREGLLLGRRRPPSAMVGAPEHRELALLAWARALDASPPMS